MREQFREHATVLVDHSLQVDAGDDVLVQAPFVAEPLVLALAEVLGERNASLHVFALSDRLREPYLGALEAKSVPDPSHTRAAFEEADGIIVVQGSANTAELNEVAPEIKASYTEALEPVRAVMLNGDWVVTQYPAPGDAQAAKMSTSAYREFVHRSVTLDWEKQEEFQQPMVDRLDAASDVRVTSDGTDLRFSVDGMCVGEGFEPGRVNLPDGEVGTAPVPDSVEGEVLFDLPVQVQGTTVEDVHLSFEEGEVVEWSAERGEEALEGVLSTDGGARRLGEFGIGMNRSIERTTQNTLLDEKMGDTVHFALGKALPETVGPDRDGNESAVHEDLLVDMREQGTIELDGEVVYRSGKFVWEEEFESGLWEMEFEN